MATSVTEKQSVTLLDGTELELGPLNIKNQRLFMDAWTDFVESVQANLDKPEEEQLTPKQLNNNEFDVYIKLCALGLKPHFTDDYDTKQLDDAFKKKSGPFADYLEEVLDRETIYVVLDATGGLKLNDPNLQAAAMMDQAGRL